MFRFSIRDLLWLMVVVAMACGWWLERQRFTPADRELLTVAKNLGLQFERAKTGGPAPAPGAVLVPGVSHPK